jgi:hypothetical protein
MKKIFKNDDTWYAFVYGTIVGILAGISIIYLTISLIMYYEN